jgi:hypothetical protein
MAIGLAAAHRAGQLDRSCVQQEFLGQGRLTGVWVGNDREGAPPIDFVFQGVRRNGGLCLVSISDLGFRIADQS